MRTLTLLIAIAMTGVAAAGDRPNILWISCEDISPNLGCYGDPHAITPNLDQLAHDGVRFSRAFTPAGVCAVVRSGVITGMFPPSIGSQHMRSRIIPPADVKAFPELLREAGYFTSNRSKTDFQFESTNNIWDAQGNKHGDWRDRSDPDQPFFSVVNFTVCHESQVRHGEEKHTQVIRQIGEDNRHDPDTVADTVPEYLPNTAAVRKNWAWYHDNITLMDKMAGELLQRLEDDGLADETIVVFWSDHGMGLPRGKRWIYDTGTLIPMIVRWPSKYPAPENLQPGSVRDDLTSVLDLAPTMLDTARIDVPPSMQGRVLFGPAAQPEPPYLFFHRDRMDEVYELQRGARDRRWKYIRNFEPEKTYAQRLDYMDEMPAMRDWRRLAAADRLTGGQKNWFLTPKPIEELYDTEKDPWELTNLADLPDYAQRLQRMRLATETWQTEIGDTGLIPEAVMMEEMKPGGSTPQTKTPLATANGNSLSLACNTEGASITFRVKSADGWGDWTLYTKSVELADGTEVECQAHRLGYQSSQTVTVK